MTITREKQIEINNAADKIYKEYLFGLGIMTSVRKEINRLMNVHPATRLTVNLLMGPAPEGIDPEIFKHLVELHSNATGITNCCKVMMINLFEPVINDIIETEYSDYLQYRADLHEEGVSAVLLAMGQEYPEAFPHYCQRIIVEMYRFLDQHRLIQE